MLIFDNADSVDDIGPWVPSGPVSAGTPGHVIVTTRRRGFRQLGTVLDLDVIDMDAAVRLLQTRAPDLDDAVAESIADVLGRLPLGLEQAAAYLDRTQIPPREYLDLLTTRQSTLLTGIGRPATRQIGGHGVGTKPRPNSRRRSCGAATPRHLRLLGARAHSTGPVHQPPRRASRTVVHRRG